MRTFIFLDFDGVLHPDPCRKSDYFCQLHLIEDVLRKKPEVKIVVSSSWRFDHELERLREFFSPDLRSVVVGVNPVVTRSDGEGWIPRHLLSHHREWECRKWLRQNHAADALWVAIDDMPAWFTPNCENLIVTASAVGFQPEQSWQLERLLEQSP
ncbi:HAD domain-containing protein [Variovorax sp. SRS16]|uniref:HAD domain-containing protein n=1 Tax=Variovorax sp. SRS16 TaxID=282217 RepID=UPI0013A52C27|nr:HAD domain-containing protein [Variovorax sp. SRS16]